MLNSSKQQNFDTPISLAFTPKGMDLFLKSNRGYDIFMTVDRKRNYGIHLSQFSFYTLKSLLEGNSICKIEMPFFRYGQIRTEIPDITRLFMNYLFHQSFSDRILTLIMDSRIFDVWMKRHQDEKFSSDLFENPLSDEFLDSHWVGGMTEEDMKSEIIRQISDCIMTEKKWTSSERNIVVLSAKKFLSRINNSVWFGLSLLSQIGKTGEYLKLIADELWSCLKKLRYGDLVADVVASIASEQLYLYIKDAVRNIKEDIRVTPSNAEQIDSEYRILNMLAENNRLSVLWTLSDSKVGGAVSRRFDIYIVLLNDSLSALAGSVHRFSNKTGSVSDYEEFCRKFIGNGGESPCACRAVVFLEHKLKEEGMNFSYVFSQTEKKAGFIQLRIQI